MKINLLKKIKAVVPAALIIIVLANTGCGSADQKLKEDTGKIAEVMCRSIEVMNRLKAADPADSALVRTLQVDEQKVQAEMNVAYDEFRKKHSRELDNPEFNKKFSKLLREEMLNCKYLSETDRENFMREIQE
jgi:hypothetical protein